MAQRPEVRFESILVDESSISRLEEFPTPRPRSMRCESLSVVVGDKRMRSEEPLKSRATGLDLLPMMPRDFVTRTGSFGIEIEFMMTVMAVDALDS